jgi:hypothetical protein
MGAILDAIERYRQLAGTEILVLIQAADGVAPKGEANLATVAAANEFGTGRLPERPFLRTTASEYGADWLQRFGNAFRGRNVDRALRRLAVKAVADVKRTIVDLDDPPNADLTIRIKGRDNPLIHTGQMLNSIRAALKQPGSATKLVG